jgi:hypothetical protein
MRKTHTKMVALIAIVALMMGLVVALPTSAGAATGAVTIDISTLGATDQDNSADVATDSQWVYGGTNKTLSLSTPFGNYNLTGMNHDLRINNPYALYAVITLDNLDLFTPTTHSYPASAFETEEDCTIVLVGSNSIEGGTNYAFAISGPSNCFITGDGSLSVSPNYAFGASGIRIYSGSGLSIIDNASVSSSGGDNGHAIVTDSDIRMGGNASLTLTNTSISPEIHAFDAITSASDGRWVLSGSAFSSDPLTDAYIYVSIPEGTTGTIARETDAVIEEPSLTAELSDAVLHFLYPQIGTTKDVTVTELLDGTVSLDDWDWEIIGNTNPLVADTLFDYGEGPGGGDDPIVVKALSPGQTVITVKVMEYAMMPDQQEGLTGRYGIATITVTVDGPPTDNGGSTVPATGDASLLGSFVSLALLGIASTACTIASSTLRKRR